jgi:putative ABC transport system permease protein
MRKYLLKLIRRRTLRADLEAELAHHREMTKAHGNPIGLGHTAIMREDALDLWRFTILENFLRDLRYAARQLRKNWAFTATAILSLALGIGLTTSIFTLLNAVAFRPLPYSDPGRLVWMTQILKANSTDEITVTADFLEWRRENHAFIDLAAYNYVTSNLSGLPEPMQVHAVKASASLLPLLGIQPFLGRGFRREEDLKGHDHVAILSRQLWLRQFAADPHIIGRPVTLDGEQFTVVGVLPRDFAFPGPDPIELMIPLGKDEKVELQRNPNGPLTLVQNIVGRLKPGISLEQAKADLTVIQSHLPQLGFHPTITIKMLPLREHLYGNAKTTSFLLIGAAAFLLLIGAANVSNLLLVRLILRDREFAVRAALGGSRKRILFQLLTEGSLLGFLGCGAGVLLAFVIRPPLLTLSPYRIAGLAGVPFDWRVVTFAISLSFIATIAFSVVPAVRAAEVRLGQAMKAGSHAVSASLSSFRTLSLIASVEIATIFILSVGAGLMIESFWRMRHASLGFQPDRLIAATLELSGRRYRNKTQQFAFIEAVLAKSKTIPGVSSAAITNAGEIPPGEWHATNTFKIEGRSMPVWSRHKPIARQEDVSAGYFGIMQIPLLYGRLLKDSDHQGEPPVAIVNMAVVRRFFNGETPIGRRVMAGGPWFTIVGVVGDVKTSGLSTPPEPTLYFPFAQRDGLSDVGVVLQSDLGTATIAAEFRDAVRRIDPSQPVASIQSMNYRLNESVAKPRFTAILLFGFAALALALGLIGVYGVMRCKVNSQLKDLAIRQAVGAQPKDVVSLVLLQSSRIILPGVCLGLLGSILLGRLLSTMLYNTRATDPATLALVSVSVIAIAIAACLAPALSAAHADPLGALRQD